jgi:hypothetical protein
LAALPCDLLGEGRQVVLAARCKDDGGARAGEGRGGRGTDPATRSRDDRNLVLEHALRVVSRMLLDRLSHRDRPL